MKSYASVLRALRTCIQIEQSRSFRGVDADLFYRAKNAQLEARLARTRRGRTRRPEASTRVDRPRGGR